ncbi:hypothetical protein ONE63_007276 [Megalurothrips usitatus]|uniref:ditrans,polycis-polyprenyl diphosphate synthase [(2E,6E)-farnesyldiphosphate specific] n=1 Tax=Megalurothrips usitatus TaxID=439358 RepID=A0AAV7XZ08_9NEOP|nr:hypothetical protein ONE63_007276 [Megalurothrips usitatus]
MATSVIYKLLYLADSARLLVLRLSHGARGRIGGILGDNSDTGTAIRRALGSKTLDHLAVILSKEEVAVADLVRVAVWSRAAGTAHVSFHDPWGRLKARRAALDQALQAAGLDPCRTAANATAEPHTAAGGRLPCVTLLDMADGKAAIARAARGLCERALVGELTSAGVSMELLDGCIVRGVGVPAPELAVCCGDVISLCGFLPWHASFTTFLLLPSLRNLSLCGFVSLLDKFSQCEQRGGA